MIKRFNFDQKSRIWVAVKIVKFSFNSRRIKPFFDAINKLTLHFAIGEHEERCLIKRRYHVFIVLWFLYNKLLVLRNFCEIACAFKQTAHKARWHNFHTKLHKNIVIKQKKRVFLISFCRLQCFTCPVCPSYCFLAMLDCCCRHCCLVAFIEA